MKRMNYEKISLATYNRSNNMLDNITVDDFCNGCVVWEYVMKLYCTQCNSELEIAEIEDMTLRQTVCMNCSRIETGYTEHEKDLVIDLQDFFKDKLWEVSFVLQIFRKHINR